MKDVCLVFIFGRLTAPVYYITRSSNSVFKNYKTHHTAYLYTKVKAAKDM